MCVRGWYMPGTMSSSISEAGVPAFAAGASPACPPSSTLGPSSASRPRPRPLGFFVTISLVFHQVLQEDVALGPACESGVGVDVTAVAVVHELRVPRVAEQAGPFEFAVRVVAAAKQHAGKRQRLQRDWRPARDLVADLGTLHVTGCDQQGRLHA